jgi:hypothetical protein
VTKPEPLTDEQQERAAIMEYDGKMSREEAERLARQTRTYSASGAIELPEWRIPPTLPRRCPRGVK